MSDVQLDNLPQGWQPMDGHTVGSSSRNTNEPGGSLLKFLPDDVIDGLGDSDGVIQFDIIDFALPSMATSAYSTALLAQKKWATQGVGRIIAADQISATIENPGPVYADLAGMIGAKGTVRIEIPNQDWYFQCRVAIMSVDGPAVVDGDRMTGSLVFTVTNTAPDDQSEMGPVWGDISESAGGTGGS